jgi:hypothetical protein
VKKEFLNVGKTIYKLDVERERIASLIVGMQQKHNFKGLEKLQIKKFKCDIIINYLAKEAGWNE